MSRAWNPVTIKEVKVELKKRHDTGEERGEDRFNLDVLEFIEQLQAENKRLITWLNRIAVTRPNDSLYSEEQHPYKMAEQALKGNK